MVPVRNEGTEENDASLAFSMDGHVGTLTRRDGYFVGFDCDADAIHFLDYDAFTHGSVSYLRRDGRSYERYGREVTICAADYDIDQGVEPDFSLTRPESFYDRQALTEIINSIR